MKPTSDILERINRCSHDHKDGVFTRLYRYLLREDIYIMAYQKLYANAGALTKGSNDDTADGFGYEYIDGIINDLRIGQYQTTPLRRIYIPKRNGKMRPLSIPSFRDKLLQEAVRMILEAIYEPTFDNCSHGFRPKRSCHTALKQISFEFKGVSWFIEGDIHACFDCIDHNVLLSLLSNKIKDRRFLNIIRKFLKTGYIDDWTYNNTYSGTPQGGICSPILANIYLHELDTKVREIKERMEESNTKPHRNPEYCKINSQCAKLSKEIDLMPVGTDRSAAIMRLKALQKQKFDLPYSINNEKLICYVRYADDWLIGVKGSKSDCVAIKEEVKNFLRSELKLELSEEKTLITHSSQRVRFLGYDISVRRSQDIRGFRNSDGKWIKRRSLNHKVALMVPTQDRIMSFLFKKKAVKQSPNGKIVPIHRNELLQKPDVEVVKTYNSEIRGILNFYGISSNYASLAYFVYLMEASCLKTLACKHKSTCNKIRKKYQDGHGWSVPTFSRKKTKRVGIIKFWDYPRKFYSDEIKEYHFYGHKSELWKRIQRGYCELCNVKMERNGVVHMVKKMEYLGNKPWEKLMKKMRRKTLIICHPCHNMIHASC